jgi:hypothetical protein
VYTRPPDQRRVAVNVDGRESTTARLTAEEFAGMLQADLPASGHAPERLARQVEARQNLWRYGLMLMLCALAAESAIGRSR